MGLRHEIRGIWQANEGPVREGRSNYSGSGKSYAQVVTSGNNQRKDVKMHHSREVGGGGAKAEEGKVIELRAGEEDEPRCYFHKFYLLDN